MHQSLLALCLYITANTVIATTNISIPIDERFWLYPNAKVSALYQSIREKVTAPYEISIVFADKVILNLVDDDRTVSKIGMNETHHDITIIRKPDYVALLEMVIDIDNVEDIPWLNEIMDILSQPDVSANRCHHLSQLGHALKCDHNGHLIELDLSHLNLSGSIHLEMMPQTVLSLDLSFNDFDSLDLNELRGTSLEKLNVENNRRCLIDTKCFQSDMYASLGDRLPLRELQLSSYQIVPWDTKHHGMNNWFYHRDQRTLRVLIVDGVLLSADNPMTFRARMLMLVDKVTNKEMIPWYQLWKDEQSIHARKLTHFGIKYRQNRRGISCAYTINLGGLGLQGHVDLGYLPRNVFNVDLSNNNLSSISCVGDGEYNLRELSLMHNDNLHIDWLQIDASSPFCCLYSLHRLRVSSNQLDLRQEPIWEWLAGSPLKTVVVDHVVLQRSTRDFQKHLTEN